MRVPYLGLVTHANSLVGTSGKYTGFTRCDFRIPQHRTVAFRQG